VRRTEYYSEAKPCLSANSHENTEQRKYHTAEMERKILSEYRI